MAHINIVETLLPEFKYTPEECVKYYRQWIADQDEKFKKKAELIFKNTMIASRHSIAPIETIFTLRSFQETNDLFRAKSEELCTKLFLQTIEASNLKPEDIDVFITTSCTGYMIPAVNFFIADKVKMRKDVRHIPITEIGCAAGIAALLFADDYVKAYPDAKVMVMSHEFPSNTVQLGDFSWQNLIGNVIFADGLGCAIVSNESKGPKIVDTELYHMSDKTDVLGYNIMNTGLQMTLDKSIPKIIEAHFHDIINSIYKRNSLELKDIDHFMFHPGGVKILDKIENIIRSLGKHVNESRKIMSTLGNLSSSTIFFILKDVMQHAQKEQKGLGVSFGPGFSTYQLLLEW